MGKIGTRLHVWYIRIGSLISADMLSPFQCLSLCLSICSSSNNQRTNVIATKRAVLLTYYCIKQVVRLNIYMVSSLCSAYSLLTNACVLSRPPYLNRVNSFYRVALSAVDFFHLSTWYLHLDHFYYSLDAVNKFSHFRLLSSSIYTYTHTHTLTTTEYDALLRILFRLQNVEVSFYAAKSTSSTLLICGTQPMKNPNIYRL